MGGIAMQEYELIWERFNACAGDRYGQTQVLELELEDPAAYVQAQFSREKALRVEQRRNGESLVFEVYVGEIHQRLTFTPV